MPDLKAIPIRSLLAIASLLALTPAAHAVVAETGVSHALAIARAARLSHLRYRLSFTLKEHASTVLGSEDLTFDSKSGGDLLIDYRDGVLQSATLNRRAIPTELENGHLHLPTVAGPNTLHLTFLSNAAPAGKAITSYEDKDDGSEYIYTLFVPMDASMAFPCFDQPDLKAEFSLALEHPAAWTVVGNTAPVLVDGTHAEFPVTRPISTYLFAFAAGPFVAVRSQNPAEPAVYVRKSQLARARQEAPQVQLMAARGIAYLSAYFARPFPFPKYDLVLIPGFPFGGMEHAGATFLNEDGILFRSTPTPSDYFRRNILVLHETCHQWFGDLVTMRWFDDLWLKEGFAQYMAYKAMAQLEPASNPWKHFYEDIKPLAYGIDETQGTTPIFQNIANLKDAKSAYGAIVYQKAPAVLKQLNYFLGEDTFRDGLRLYLKQHAYANAEWADLIGAFETASDANKQHRDVQNWAKAWILQRGMPQVEVTWWSCTSGKISELALTQHDVLGTSATWPITNELLLAYPTDKADYLPGQPTVVNDLSAARAARFDTLRVTWDTPSFSVAEAVGKPCPAFIFANGSDKAYGRFLLDDNSQNVVEPRIAGVADPLLRSQLWGALWENVRIARTAPYNYFLLAQPALAAEADESLSRIQGGRITTLLHSWLGPKSRGLALTPAEDTIFARMTQAPTLELRIVNFRTFTSIAESPHALGTLKSLLDGSLIIDVLDIKPLDRWNLFGHLIALNDPDATAIYAAERARDTSGEGQKYAYAAAAGMPSAATKADYFEQYLHSPTLQEDWITQSLRSFNAWNQSALTRTYLVRSLDELPEIKQHRKIFFLGAWLGAFIDGQNTLKDSPAAQAEVRNRLAGKNIDPDLRLKVLEASDALDRTVLIGQKFPQ